jgi:uncharacterized protein DUF3575
MRFTLVMLSLILMSAPASGPAGTGSVTDDRKAGEPKASAQADTTQSAQLRRNVISANPFGLLGGWFNAEYERMVSHASSVGIHLSRLTLPADYEDEDDSYSTGRVFWRYYPSGAFRGFLFSVHVGVTRQKENVFDEASMMGVVAERTRLGTGFDLGYSWLMGSRRNFYFSPGLGGERLYGQEDDGVPRIVPILRLNVGFAF